MGAHSRRVVCTPRGPGQVRGKREAWGGPGCDRPAPPAPPSLPADDAVTSSTSESSALSKKRFTLQSFAALKAQKGKGARHPQPRGGSRPGCLSSPAVPCSSVWTVSGGRLPPSSPGSIFHPVALCPQRWCVCHPCGQSSFRGLFFGKEEACASDGGLSWRPKCPLPAFWPSSSREPILSHHSLSGPRLPESEAFTSLWAVRTHRQVQSVPRWVSKPTGAPGQRIYARNMPRSCRRVVRGLPARP